MIETSRLLAETKGDIWYKANRKHFCGCRTRWTDTNRCTACYPRCSGGGRIKLNKIAEDQFEVYWLMVKEKILELNDQNMRTREIATWLNDNGYKTRQQAKLADDEIGIYQWKAKVVAGVILSTGNRVKNPERPDYSSPKPRSQPQAGNCNYTGEELLLDDYDRIIGQARERKLCKLVIRRAIYEAQKRVASRRVAGW